MASPSQSRSLPPTPPSSPGSAVSPRLAALQRELEHDDGAITRFWHEIAERGTPLVEPAAGTAEDGHGGCDGDDGDVLVTLLWRGDADTRNVVCETPFDSGDPADCQMTLLAGTDVWYRTFRAPDDLRFSYCVPPNDPLIPWSRSVPWSQRVATWRPDPLNQNRPITFPRDEEAPSGDSRAAAWAHSTVELPNARRDQWRTPRAGTPQGRVEVRRLTSPLLLPCAWLEPPRGDTRRAWVYTPPGYAARAGSGSSGGTRSDSYQLLVLVDGYDYVHYIDAPTILDNLVADGRVPPLVALFLDTPNGVRGHELLRCSPRFADALAEHVVPWVRAHYHVAEGPNRTIVGGFSAGGSGAAYCALRHPEVFGGVLSQSGAYWWRPDGEREHEWLAGQFAAVPVRPVRFHLTVGRLETWAPPGRPSQLLANHHLRTVLEARGYSVDYAEFAGGHSFFCWQLALADGLVSLLGGGWPHGGGAGA